jgi:hypothetical protein
MAHSTDLTNTRALVPAESDDPDVIRRQIDYTRAQLSDTINAIGERLSPENLIEQAKSSAKEATVGRIRDMRYEANRRMEGMSSGLGQTVRENPLPVAVIGLGLGWLWLAGRNRQDDYRADYRSSGYRYYEGAEGQFGREYGRSYGHMEGGRIDQARDRMGEMAYNVAHEVDERAGEVKQRVGSAVNEVGETVGDVAHRAGDALGDAADRVTQSISGAAERVGDVGQTVSERAGMAQERLSEAAMNTRNEAERLRREAQWRSQVAMERTKQSFWNSMETSPLAVGAVLALAGAAIGASIPATEAENRLLGETRDRLVEEARTRAHDAVERVQGVVEDTQRAAMTEVKDAAQRHNLPIGNDMESSTTTRTGGFQSPDISGSGTSAGPGSSGGSSVSNSGDRDLKSGSSTGSGTNR